MKFPLSQVLNIFTLLVCEVSTELIQSEASNGKRATTLDGVDVTFPCLTEAFTLFRNSLNELKLKSQSFDALKPLLETLRLQYFKRSDVYNGRRYYLSLPGPSFKAEQAVANCTLYGGTLVEIEDLNEFNFVKSFITQHTGFRLVLIGGTDTAKQEDWRYRSNNALVPSFLVQSRKFGTCCDCLYLHDAINWLAVDDMCYYTNPSFPTRYLCEMVEF